MKLESKTIRGLTYTYIAVCTFVPFAAAMIYFDLDPEAGNVVVNTIVTAALFGWFGLVSAGANAVERTLTSLFS